MKPKSRQQIRLEAKASLIASKLQRAMEDGDLEGAEKLAKQFRDAAEEILRWAKRILN